MSSGLDDATREEFIKALSGETKDSVGVYLRRIDWNAFGKIHSALPGMKDVLSRGLRPVLEKHWDALHDPLFHLGGDEIDSLIKDLDEMSKGLTFAADLVLGPLFDENASIQTQLNHAANTRLMELAALSRGDSREKTKADVKAEDILKIIARYRQVGVMAQLAAEIDRVMPASAHATSEPHLHPFQQVIGSAQTFRQMAVHAENARTHLSEREIDRTAKKELFKDDLWEAWGEHLIALGTSSKGRPLIQSKSSDLFNHMVNELLASFDTPRPRVRHKVRLENLNK